MAQKITLYTALLLTSLIGCSSEEGSNAGSDTAVPLQVDTDSPSADAVLPAPDSAGLSDVGAADTAGQGDITDTANVDDIANFEDIADTADVDDSADVEPIDIGPPPANDGIHGYAGGCYAIQGFDGVNPPKMLVSEGGSFSFSDLDPEGGARFHVRAADLATYLLYDTERHYVVASKEAPITLGRVATLETSLSLMDIGFISPAEWELEVSALDPTRFQLRQRQSGWYLSTAGLVPAAANAAIITLLPREGCVDYPELGLDATGSVTPHAWEDGSVYGIAEMHAHMTTNMGFGGGSIFHGAPFHRLGVEYALPDCSPYHGEDGRRDLVSLFYDKGLAFDLESLLPLFVNGETDEYNHATGGYPTFDEWPNARKSSTHQTMYYRWLERAYLGGLRLVVHHATGNSVLCDIVLAVGSQQVRYDCNDMVGVGYSITEMRGLERYIDAQAGGPGKGWLRIVESAAEARAAVQQGKMAVILGIEISNLFDCYPTEKPGFPACTPESLDATLDYYYGLGVRAIFPVHKYDNGFSAGDGAGGVIELGNVLNSGHYSNFVQDCPGPAETFDGGEVTFGGMNKPREQYDAPPAIDTSGYKEDLLGTLFPYLADITAPPLQGNYCQKTGLTPLGESLMLKLMQRGMLIDIAHLPQRSVARAYELLEANDYPATKTHGQSVGDRIYGVDGLTGIGLGGCANPGKPKALMAELAGRTAVLTAKGAYVGQPIALDLNGFAGAVGPRFGPESGCGQEQTNPVTYPFTSYDGQVTFTQAHLGERTVDFNTEGLIHVGLLPELIQDLRLDGATDDDLEPLFRSAEAWIRLWEKAETRAKDL
jgi:microsomal dipeptidase-like Zn-dependent dipeptidase